MSARETIEPKIADGYIARLLGVAKDSMLLHVEHTAYMGDGGIAYFASSNYRGDRVKFTIELKAGDG